MHPQDASNVISTEVPRAEGPLWEGHKGEIPTALLFPKVSDGCGDA
jgi:hypothetical protein